MQNARSDPGKVSAVKTSYRILEELRRLEGARITELSGALDLAPSTIYRHLSTLESLEYVVNDGNEYRIGLQYLTLGADAREQTPAYRLAKEQVVKLAEKTMERAQFVVEEHGRGIHIYTRTGENAVTADAGIGKRVYLHASSAGKAILAALPTHERDRHLDVHGLPEITENTITDRKTLEAALEEIDDRGYAFNEEESIDGLKAVGAPVRGSDGQVIGALSVSAPMHRLKGEKTDEHLDALLGAVNELEIDIEYSDR